MNKGSKGKHAALHHLLNMTRKRAEADASSSNAVAATKDDGIVTEFNVTGNKLTPISSSASASASSTLNEITSEGNDEKGDKVDHDEPKKRSATTKCHNQSDNDDSTSFEGHDDDYDEDDDPVIGNCLHCNLPPPPSSSSSKTNNTSNVPTAPGIQVSCDDCHSFICSACHWCHEYQANHEIRVCDRCDAFYCKGCDEMDQCEDCGEVVCGGCGALCSCKFCGCGLCEDCATACGRYVIIIILDSSL